MTFAEGTTQTSADPIQVPDSSARYFLADKHSVWANDDTALKVENGLLTSVSSKPDDRTGEVVQKIVSSVRSAAGSGMVTFDLKLKTSEETKQTTVVFDPFGDPPVGITVDWPARGKGAEIPKGLIRDKCPADASLCVPVLTYVIVHVQKDNSEFRVLVADPVRVYGVKLNRVACAKGEHEITVQDGFLTEYKSKKPSEIESCASIPLNIVSAIIAAPFDAITGRTARLKAEKELAAAQLELIKAQAALLESKKSN